MIEYPDVSSYQNGLSLTGAKFVCAKASEGNDYKDSAYAGFKAQAASKKIPFTGYHFLRASSVNSISSQAQLAYSVMGKIPAMVDCESEKGSSPTYADLVTFIDFYRQLGGILHAVYLPEWYWSSTMGSPSLKGLITRHCFTVASNYSGSGGWNSYGGITPTILQFTDTEPFNGMNIDFNRYGGTLSELVAIFSGRTVKGKIKVVDFPLDLLPANSAVVIPCAGATVLTLYADEFGAQVPPEIRVIGNKNLGVNILKPNWDKPSRITIPAECEYISVSRQDEGICKITASLS